MVSITSLCKELSLQTKAVWRPHYQEGQWAMITVLGIRKHKSLILAPQETLHTLPRLWEKSLLVSIAQSLVFVQRNTLSWQFGYITISLVFLSLFFSFSNLFVYVYTLCTYLLQHTVGDKRIACENLHESPRDRTQVISLGKCVYPLSHLTCPSLVFSCR